MKCVSILLSIIFPIRGVCLVTALFSVDGKFTCTNVQTRALQHLLIGDMLLALSLGSSAYLREAFACFLVCPFYSAEAGKGKEETFKEISFQVVDGAVVWLV